VPPKSCNDIFTFNKLYTERVAAKKALSEGYYWFKLKGGPYDYTLILIPNEVREKYGSNIASVREVLKKLAGCLK